MVYLLDPETGHLRFAHDAGIQSARSRAWVRSIRLPIGTGMFGNAVTRRAVVHTDDYLIDPAFDHAPDPDRVVEDIGIRSMVVAPLVPRRRGLRRARRVQHATGGLQRLPDRPRPGARRPRRGGDGQRPAHRGPRPRRGPSWPSAPRRSAPCARSTPGSAPPPTCRPSCSGRSTRPPACCAPRAPAST